MKRPKTYIKIRYSVNSIDKVEFAGRTVGDIFGLVAATMNIPPGSAGMVDGVLAPDSTVVRGGQTLEFVKTPGAPSKKKTTIAYTARKVCIDLFIGFTIRTLINMYRFEFRLSEHVYAKLNGCAIDLDHKVVRGDAIRLFDAVGSCGPSKRKSTKKRRS